MNKDMENIIEKFQNLTDNYNYYYRLLIKQKKDLKDLKELERNKHQLPDIQPQVNYENDEELKKAKKYLEHLKSLKKDVSTDKNILDRLIKNEQKDIQIIRKNAKTIYDAYWSNTGKQPIVNAQFIQDKELEEVYQWLKNIPNVELDKINKWPSSNNKPDSNLSGATSNFIVILGKLIAKLGSNLGPFLGGCLKGIFKGIILIGELIWKPIKFISSRLWNFIKIFSVKSFPKIKEFFVDDYIDIKLKIAVPSVIIALIALLGYFITKKTKDAANEISANATELVDGVVSWFDLLDPSKFLFGLLGCFAVVIILSGLIKLIDITINNRNDKNYKDSKKNEDIYNNSLILLSLLNQNEQSTLNRIYNYILSNSQNVRDKIIYDLEFEFNKEYDDKKQKYEILKNQQNPQSVQTNIDSPITVQSTTKEIQDLTLEKNKTEAILDKFKQDFISLNETITPINKKLIDSNEVIDLLDKRDGNNSILKYILLGFQKVEVDKQNIYTPNFIRPETSFIIFNNNLEPSEFKEEYFKLVDITFKQLAKTMYEGSFCLNIFDTLTNKSDIIKYMKFVNDSVGIQGFDKLIEIYDASSNVEKEFKNMIDKQASNLEGKDIEAKNTENSISDIMVRYRVAFVNLGKKTPNFAMQLEQTLISIKNKGIIPIFFIQEQDFLETKNNFLGVLKEMDLKQIYRWDVSNKNDFPTIQKYK